MELLVVRHGRTAWNAERRFQGHTDVPLDATGLAQATALGEMLARERIDIVVSSDLQRAQETARRIVGARTLALRLDADWRELQFGDWEGLTWPEIVARHPEFELGNETKPRSYTPDRGESFDALVARVERGLQRVVAETPRDGVALIATHAGPLHALVRLLATAPGEDPMEIRFVPASVTRFAQDDDGVWQLAMLNRTPDLPIFTS